MVDDTVLIPGGRDVRATLDRATGGSVEDDEGPEGRTGGEADDAGGPAADGADAAVVACPPHPQHRGHRGDDRLVAVSDALTERGIDCLRFDYGPWDEGYGEREDARNALRWAADRYERVGLFGFSFGAAIALLTAAGRDDLAAVSALAPAARLAADLDAAAAVDEVAAPLQVVYGVRDDTVDWGPVVDRAREREAEVIELSADHFFVGQGRNVGEAAASFFEPHLG
ncbi:dienelactone hydrolase family protein [Halegenticoccus soli]|uniref:dienelactone hydrolase family protein n=1 Tax=Halegenticoccus soli TaxID=1985678 RepID=UPI000C6D4635|nr:dienelactone hydrolase family protein [Halegenticoccus soli]